MMSDAHPEKSSSLISDLEINLFLSAIFQRYHYDFRNYSRSSVRRRLQQAVFGFGLESLSQLQHLLLHQPGTIAKVLDYLTIPTTELFRDPSFYKAIRTKVIPYLKTYPSIKIWIAGCSTGEEVYSYAILLKEEGLLDKSIIYATDINPRHLQEAKRGIYSNETLKKGSANYLEAGGHFSLSDYYNSSFGRGQLDSQLRKRVTFSDHSLVTDEVFSEMHLISCRNVLIYFERNLQDRAIGLFKKSLVRSGFLCLGSKESLHFSAHEAEFEEFDSTERIFRKQDI